VGLYWESIAVGKFKAWQIIVLVLGLAALGYLAFTMLTAEKGDQLADRVYGVDVVTGDIFYFDMGGKRGGVVWPAVNPDTGQTNILPAYEEEVGVWVISEHYRSAIGTMTPESERVDQRTGRVEATDAAPKSGR